MKDYPAHLTSAHLGKLKEVAKGVFSSGYADEDVSRYVHDIFNTDEGAESYAKRYKQHDYFKRHISRVLDAEGVQHFAAPTILDIGSGSGNTVFPALEIFPESSIIATDLSVPLLAILARTDTSGRILAIQENAQDLNFKPDSFDVIIGGAILHHLFHPEQSIQQAYRLLKPGGICMFFEPCQNGQILTKLGYERILSDTRASKLSREARQIIMRQINFIDFRLHNRPDTNPKPFEKMEDKWVFSKSYLIAIAESQGAKGIRATALDPTANPIEAKIRSNFRILGSDLPDWAWKVVKDFDESLPHDFKNENPAGVAFSFRK